MPNMKYNPLKKLSLAGRLSIMVFIVGLLVYIPSSFLGAYNNLKQSKAELTSYKERLETRVKTAFEIAVWNYDIETLRKLINAELGNDNLRSLKVNTQDRVLIWISSGESGTYDETFEPSGEYIDERIIPLYRMDDPAQTIAYVKVWFDNAPIRSKFYRQLLVEVLAVGGILLLISVAVTISSYVSLVRPLEAIRKSMIEAGKSALIPAKEKIEKARFKRAFPEIRRMGSDLDYMLKEIDKAYKKLRESENQFKAIFEHAGVGVAQMDALEGNFLLVNQRYMDILGYKWEELKNLTCRDITHQDDIEEQMEKHQKLITGEYKWYSQEKRFIRKDGKTVWVQMTITPLWEQGEHPTTYIAVIEDTTTRKMAEEKIRRLNEELEEKVVERTADLENANCELEATIEDLKTAQAQLISTEKMAVLGQLVAGIAHELNTPLGIINSAGGTMERILQNDMNRVIEFCAHAPREAYEAYSSLLKSGAEDDKDNTYKRQIRKKYYNIMDENNISISEEVLEKLVDMGYNADKGDFFELVNKPENLEAVKMAYNVVTMKKSTNMIRVATEKASKVIMALKLYSHKDTTTEVVEHDVIKDVEMVLTLYYNQIKYGVEIVRNYEKVPLVKCYPDKLHQVWVNIINNALQAMDYKGRLIISVENSQDSVLVSITDNGPGIPEHIRNRIFEPFFTTKKLGEGTGLGLDIVKRIIDEINGRIQVESKQGETTFKIWLKT